MRDRLYRNLSNVIMPGEVRKEARALAVRRMAMATGRARSRPDPDSAVYMSIKQDGTDVLTQLARNSRNDVIIKRDGDRILWRRRIKPQVLSGIYDLVSWVNAGVNEIEKWVNAEGWVIAPKDGGGAPRDREMLMEFFEARNSDGDYIEDLTADIVVDSISLGDHHTELGRFDGTGDLAELSTIAGETVHLETDKDGNLIRLVQMEPRSGKKIGQVEREDFMQFRRNARGRSLFGSSIFKGLLMAVESDVNSQVWNRDGFKHRNAAARAWIFPQDTSPQAMDANEANITQARGVGGSHQDIMLRAAGGEINIEKLDVTPKDMEYEKMRRMSREEFLGVLGVPPMLLGIIEAGNIGGGTGKDQIRKFVKGTVIPMQRRIARMYTDRIIKAEFGVEGWKFRFSTDDIVDENDRAETEKIYVEAGIKTVDEARETIGLPPLDQVAEEEAERAEKMLTKSLSSATAETEIVPIPRAPQVTAAVMKLKGGILQVLRRWRSKVNVRIRSILGKQEFGVNDFEEDIKARDMELVLAAGLATAARAGLRHGRSLGGDPSDEALARIRPIAQLRAQELAGEIAGDVVTQIESAVAAGVERGAGAREIAADVLKVFDEPRLIEVAASVNEEGQVIRVAHTRTLDANKWAEMVARTEASETATQSSLTSFEAARITKVRWRTARFRVDQKICAKVDGRIFLLQDALQSKLIPAHPHCRCTFEPAPDSAEVNGSVTQVRALQAKHEVRFPNTISKQEGGDPE
jgi:HK97 family phage portal protein